MPTWDQVSELFAWDGSLRDVYVKNAGPAEWRALFKGLKGAGYSIRYRVGEEEVELPTIGDAAFFNRGILIASW